MGICNSKSCFLRSFFKKDVFFDGMILILENRAMKNHKTTLKSAEMVEFSALFGRRDDLTDFWDYDILLHNLPAYFIR